ncbi:MAG: hypothetical protein EHM25_14515, partial [Nitrosopumilales archaeon]
MTTEEIATKYNSAKVTKESIKFQHMVEDYAVLLQSKVKNQDISAKTCVVMIPPVKLFCEMNDIILNWRKIGKLLPRGSSNALDEAYTREQIRRMLEFADLRTKIPILFMASGGMRLGGFQSLTDDCIRPIYDEKTG